MTLITWQDAYSVGVELLDDDHRLLVSLINQLEESTSSEDDENVTGSVLSVLVEYTKSHFAREELMMKKAGYPALDDHLLEHQKLSQQVQEVLTRYRAGEHDSLNNDVLIFLRSWLMGHILGVDKQYSPYLKTVTLTAEEILACMGCDDMSEELDPFLA